MTVRKKADEVASWIGSWMRNTVPPGHARAVLTLVGTAPLLMNRSDYDRDSEMFRSFYLLGKKRGKSLDDEKRLRELEWKLALYHDAEVGPFIPDGNIHELLRSAATKWRKGEDVKRSLVVVDTRVPLLYDGPRDSEALWEQRFKDERMAANAGIGSGRVVRCRPKFEEWSLVADLAYDPEDIDFDLLGLIAERAQRYGLGDYRPRFGRFTALLEAGEIHQLAVNGDPTSARDEVYERAHAAFREAIMR